MKLSKVMLALAATSVSLSGVAFAQATTTTAPAAAPAVTATKQSPIKMLLPGAYASVELRHETLRKEDANDKVVDDIPYLELLPTVGTTLFDGKVDTSFTWAFARNPGSMTVDKVDAYNVTLWKVLDGADGYIGPYAEIHQMTTDRYYNYTLGGLLGTAHHSVDIPTGALSFSGYLQPTWVFTSGRYANQNKMGVRNDTSRTTLALTAANEDKIAQRDPSILNQWGVGAKYKPALVKGLSVGLGIDFVQEWDPNYRAKDVGTETRYDLTGYTASVQTMNRLILSYEVNDKISVVEQLRQFVGGFYDHGITAADKNPIELSYRWENRLALTATLL